MVAKRDERGADEDQRPGYIPHRYRQPAATLWGAGCHTTRGIGGRQAVCRLRVRGGLTRRRGPACRHRQLVAEISSSWSTSTA